MKLILFSLISFHIFSSSGGPKDKFIVSTVKQKEIQDQLAKNPELKKCKSADNQDQCIDDLVSSMDEKQLEKIAKDIKGADYQLDGGAKTQAIRKFMQERIKKVIYGDKKPEEISKTVIDHNKYRDIYKSQLGKNMFLDINTYCLENVGFDEKLSSIINGEFVIENDKVKKDKHGIKQIKYINVGIVKGNNLVPQDSYSTGEIENFWTNLIEYTKGDFAKADTRSVQDLKKLKEASINYYQKNSGAASSGTAICRDYVIEGMCAIYKCNNTKLSNLTKKEVLKCNAYGVSPSDKIGVNKKGKIACGLITRLEAYKKTLKSIDEQKEGLANIEDSVKFNSALEVVNPEYKEIDELTSISSKELTNEAESLKNLEKDAQKIKEECENDPSSDFCLKAMSKIDQDDKKSINLENKIANAVYRERLLKLGASGNKDEFEKFLKENGLYDKYGKNLENADESAIEDLSKIIANDYQAKKDALKDTMMQKFKDATGANSNGSTAKITASEIDKKVKEVKEEKDYIETMYEYNNIVTSYLKLEEESADGTQEDRKVVGSFDQNRKNELEALKKYAKTDAEMKEYEKYKNMFNDNNNQNDNNSKSVDDIDFLGFIDSVIGSD